MLDPALGGLIGAGDTTLAALITTGRTRKDERRELQRSAYAQVMAAVGGLVRCDSLEDVRVIEARLSERRSW